MPLSMSRGHVTACSLDPGCVPRTAGACVARGYVAAATAVVVDVPLDLAATPTSDERKPDFFALLLA